MAISAVDSLLREKSHVSAFLAVISTIFWWFGCEFESFSLVPLLNGLILLSAALFIGLKFSLCPRHPNFDLLLAIGDALIVDTANLGKFIFTSGYGLLLIFGAFASVYLVVWIELNFWAILSMVCVTRHCAVAVSQFLRTDGRNAYVFAMDDADMDMDSKGRVRCGVCVKEGKMGKYYEWSDMSHHVSSRHRKSFFCDVCWETSFKKAQDLKKHLNDHRVLKKERCVECGSRYFTRFGCMKHEYRAHSLHRDDLELAAKMAEEAGLGERY